MWTQIRLLFWSGPFASILNSSIMLGSYLQQTTSADDNFSCIFFDAFRVILPTYHTIFVCAANTTASLCICGGIQLDRFLSTKVSFPRSIIIIFCKDYLRVLLYFSFPVKAATLIFISGCGSAISSAKIGKSGFIYNLVKS